jgi:hypothetical protein
MIGGTDSRLPEDKALVRLKTFVHVHNVGHSSDCAAWLDSLLQFIYNSHVIQTSKTLSNRTWLLVAVLLGAILLMLSHTSPFVTDSDALGGCFDDNLHVEIVPTSCALICVLFIVASIAVLVDSQTLPQSEFGIFRPPM